MSDQQIHKKIGDAAQHMQHRAKSRLLKHVRVKVSTPEPLSARFFSSSRKEYRRALFQAALNGDIPTLDALAGQVEVTNQLIDEEACDNALWVAVAENQTSFALALLQTTTMRDKITLPGVQAAMKLSLEQKDKVLINALLKFVADADDLHTSQELLLPDSA